MVLVALRRRSNRVAEWLRVLVGGLMVTVLLQGYAALLTLVHGPAHRHLPTMAREASAEQAREGESAVVTERRARELAHELAHAEGRAHHHHHHHGHDHGDHGDDHGHDAADVPIPDGANPALDAAAFLLLAALMPLATAFQRWSGERQRAGWRASSVRGRAQRTVPPPRRPPRG